MNTKVLKMPGSRPLKAETGMYTFLGEMGEQPLGMG